MVILNARALMRAATLPVPIVAEHHPIIVVDALPAGALFKEITLNCLRAETEPVERFERAKIAHLCGLLTAAELEEYEVGQ